MILHDTTLTLVDPLEKPYKNINYSFSNTLSSNESMFASFIYIWIKCVYGSCNVRECEF
jgi:hypothetical protein